MADTATSGSPTRDALRAEHDVLAEKLATRHSIDELRKAIYGGFAAFLSFALTLKFAWDRWGWSKVTPRVVRGRYPILFLAALLLFLVLLALTIVAARRARAPRRAATPKRRGLREAARVAPSSARPPRPFRGSGGA